MACLLITMCFVVEGWQRQLYREEGDRRLLKAGRAGRRGTAQGNTQPWERREDWGQCTQARHLSQPGLPTAASAAGREQPPASTWSRHPGDSSPAARPGAA